MLWFKLFNEGVSTKMLKSVKAMYHSVKSVIKYHNNFSRSFNVLNGVKQGYPLSPLLFIFFINDMMDNIKPDTDLDVFYIDNLPSFALMYADDAVIFSKSKTGLQNMLDKLNVYCKRWNLKVNVDKTKVMIFEKGRNTFVDIYFDGTKLELVASFKYLGLTFFKNGKWYRSQKIISQYGTFALHRLQCLFKNVFISIKEQIKLFDSLVASVLNYGSEVWGYDKWRDIDIVHNKFCRYILCVKKSTNVDAMYGDLGRLPLNVFRKLRMIKYWIRIVENYDSNSLLCKTYDMMYQEVIQGRANINVSYNWAAQIKHILDESDFTYVWNNQFDVLPNFLSIKQRIIDQYMQLWSSNINESYKLNWYRFFKNNFSLQTETYLNCINNCKFRNALCKFRLSAHSLEIETGRYNATPLEQRICKFCTSPHVENEYHF